MRTLKALCLVSEHNLHINMLPEGPRRFLCFNFLNVVSWQALIGTILVLHANALGIDSGKIGILNSILYFAGILGILTKGLAEKIGSKRLLLGGWTLRNILVAPIIFTPIVLKCWGLHAATILLFTTISLFCVTRALSVIAWSSWLHEIVPPVQLGRYFTVESITSRILTVGSGVVCFLAFSNTSNTAVGPNYNELWRFAAISGVGIIFGLVSIRVLRNVPGGAPDVIGNKSTSGSFHEVLRDRMFMSFLSCTAVYLCVYAGAVLLLALFLRQYLKLGTGIVLLLTSAGNLLAVFTTPRWRRLADRHGSPATMMACGCVAALCLFLIGLLAYIHPAAPVYWLLIPVCILLPVADSGSQMAASRGYMLRIHTENRHACNAIWNAGTQAVCGITSIIVGFMLKTTEGADIHMNFVICSWCAVAVLIVAGVATLRVKTPKGDLIPGPSPLYDPAHPLLSMSRVIPYVLNPKSGNGNEIK